jgi:hypothetical protein
MLVRLLHVVCPDLILSGFIVSNLSLLAACVLLHRIAMLCCEDRTVARCTVGVLLVFPTSFFLSGYYAESLFVATAAGSYYFALRRQWAAASLCAVLAGMTRQVGVLMVIPLVVEMLRIDWGQWRPSMADFRKHWAWLLVAPCGLFLYMAYLYWQFGDPFAFTRSAAAWGRYVVSPWETIISSFYRYSLFECLIYGGTLVVIVASLAIMVVYRLPVSGMMFTLLMLGIVLTMRLLESSPRYALYIFPMYLALGRLVAHRDALGVGLGMFSVLLLALFTVMFVSGYRMY